MVNFGLRDWVRPFAIVVVGVCRQADTASLDVEPFACSRRMPAAEQMPARVREIQGISQQAPHGQVQDRHVGASTPSITGEKAVDKSFSGTFESGGLGAFGVVGDAEIALKHRNHHEDAEVRFGVLVFGGVPLELVQPRFRFSFYPGSPFAQRAHAGGDIEIGGVGQHRGADQI